MKKMTRLFNKMLFMAMALACSILPASQALAEENGAGWQQEGDQMVYRKPDGSKKTETWIKGEDGAEYYLDADGYMVRDTILEINGRKYYVDENGVKVRDRWVRRLNEEDLCDNKTDSLWYYFDKNGTACAGEGKRLVWNDGDRDNIYYFDEEGHMLTGWQKITKKNDPDNTAIYYLGDENQGYVHKLWQQLEPDEEWFNMEGHDYGDLEMFYFGYDGKLVKDCESNLEYEYFRFDENGVMLKGWYPGIDVDGLEAGINRFYNEVTGVRAKGWFYASDPADQDGDPHWFYADIHSGQIYNEGGKDSKDTGNSESMLAYKVLDNNTYFFDGCGHMITGLISTDGTSLGDNPFVNEDFRDLRGDIGRKNSDMVRKAGIYYLSLEEKNLGQLQKDKKLCLTDSHYTYYYLLDKTGRAYQNVLAGGCIYGEDGAMIRSEYGHQVMNIEQDIYEKKDYRTDGTPKENAVPIIPGGSQVIISQSGKVRKDGNTTVDSITYTVKDYVIISE